VLFSCWELGVEGVRGVSASELEELPEAGDSGSVMVMKSRIKVQVSGYAITQADTWTTGDCRGLLLEWFASRAQAYSGREGGSRAGLKRGFGRM
jgi:hypothetical protein